MVKLINANFKPKRLIKVKIRSTAPLANCSLDFKKDDRIIINFTKPQFAPAPGQSAVFYSGDTVLGGGIVTLFQESENHDRQVVPACRRGRDEVRHMGESKKEVQCGFC